MFKGEYKEWASKYGPFMYAADNYFEKKQYQKTIECLDKCLKIDPSDAELWFYKGRALRFLGRLKDSFFYFNKAAELDPYDTEYLGMQAYVSNELKQSGTPYKKSEKIKLNIESKDKGFEEYGSFVSSADKLLNQDSTNNFDVDKLLSLDDTDLSIPDELLSLDDTDLSATDDLLSLDDIDLSVPDDLLSLDNTDMSTADDLLNEDSINMYDVNELINQDSILFKKTEEKNQNNDRLIFITDNNVNGYEETEETYVFLKKVLLGYVDDEGNCDTSFNDVQKKAFLSKVNIIYITGGDAAFFEEPAVFTVGIYTKKLRILNMIQAIIYTPQGYPVRSITDIISGHPIMAKIKGDIERGLFPK